MGKRRHQKINVPLILWLVMTTKQKYNLVQMCSAKSIDTKEMIEDNYLYSLKDLYDIPTKKEYNKDPDLYNNHFTALLLYRDYDLKEIKKMIAEKTFYKTKTFNIYREY